MYEEAAETMLSLQRRQREVWNYLSDVSLLNTDLSEMCFCVTESDKDSKYLSVHQDHLRSLLKMQVLGPTLTDSELAWGPGPASVTCFP